MLPVEAGVMEERAGQGGEVSPFPQGSNEVLLVEGGREKGGGGEA